MKDIVYSPDQLYGSQYQYIDVDEGLGSYHSSLCGDVSASPKWADTARNQHHQNHLGDPIVKRNLSSIAKRTMTEWLNEIYPKAPHVRSRTCKSTLHHLV